MAAGKPGTILPLTSAQYGVWAAQKLDPDNPRYNCASYLEIPGSIDVEKLRAAVRIALTEAEALRVRFSNREKDGEPGQLVSEIDGECLEFIDVSDAPSPRKAATGWMLDDLARPVDLNSGRLVRHAILHEGPDSTLLYLRYHHIVMDGLGQTAHLRRVAELYSSLSAGSEPSPSPALPLRDLVEADLAYGASDVRRRDRAYWLDQFKDRPDLVSLGGQSAGEQRGLLRYATTFSEADLVLLRNAAEQLGTRPAVLLVAAAAAYQSRITATPNTLLRIPLPARHSGAAIRTPSMCANELPVRFSAPGSTSFAELVSEVEGKLADAVRHQRFRGEELWREVFGAEQRQRTGTTVNVVSFDSEVSFAGNPSTAHHLSSGPVDDLQLDFFTDSRTTRVKLTVDVNPLHHAPGAPRTHGRRLLALLRDALTEPGKPVGRLSLMDDAERRDVAARSTPLPRDYDLDTSLHRLVERQAERTPDAVAAQVSGGSLTYAELVDRSRRLAAHLGEQGAGPGSVVGMCQERSLDLIVSLLGVLMSGAAYLPLDPELPSARLEFLVEDAESQLVLCDSNLTERLRGTGARVVEIDRTLPRLPAAAAARPDVSAEAAAYVIYTSGSTGTPKGVVVPHRGVVNRLLWMQEEYRLTTGDCVLQKTPFTFDVSVWEFFWPLITGARLHLAEPGAHRDPRALAATMVEHAVSTVHFVPPMLDAFLAEAALPRMPHLSRVICSGEALRPETVEKFLSRYGSGPDAPALFNLYGPTEASIDVTHWRCTERDTTGPVPIGRAVANTGLYVLDPGGEPLPFGVRGELHIGGVQVATGYLNRPELTAACFSADPFRPHGVMYRTGDLAVMRPDGVLEYHGRIDHQVKVRGFRIEPGEIESVLLGLDGVESAVVTARRRDDDRHRLLAHVVAPGADTGRLERELRALLPEYMIPSAIVPLDALPLLPNGKVDRRALPDPAEESAATGAPGTEPDGTAERLLHDAFASVLGMNRVPLGIPFFALGGDSILSIRMRTWLERSGFTFDLRDLYDAPTVRGLALRIRPYAPADPRPGPFSLLPEPDRKLLPPNLDDAYPLSAMQTGMLFHAAFETDSSVYRVVTSIRIGLPFDEQALREALDATARRHPALRSSFHLTGYTEPVQQVHRDVQLPLEVDTSLAGAEAAEQARSLHEWAESAKYREFDLTQAPLLTFTAHALDEASFQLGVVEHHIVLDGWSDAALLDEIVARYRAALDGEDLMLPAITSTFRDYIAAERAAVADGEHRSFWEAELAGAEAAPLPLRTVPRAETPQHRRFDVRVDRRTASSIAAAARAAELPAKALLAAAHAAVLACVAPGEEVLTGLIAHGRLEEDGGDQAIGVFLNTLPLRLAVGDRTWIELAQEVWAHEQRTAPHRRYPYAQILKDLGDLSLDSYVNFMDFHRRWGSDHAIQDGFGIAETNFPLAVNFLVDPAGGRLELWLDCDTAVLDPEFCVRLAGYYERALAALAADAHAPPPADLRDAAERRRLREWDDTVTPYDRTATVDRSVLSQIRADPSATALCDAHEQLDYAELDARANRLARHLRARGTGLGDRVGVCVRRSVDLVVTLLAVVRSGAAYVPMDPDFPEDRLRYIAEDAGLDCMILGHGTRPPETLSADALVRLVEDADAIASCSTEPVEVQATADDPVYVIYTSGSTGRPKGTVLLHRNVVNFFAGMDRTVGIGADDVVLALTSVSFDISVLELLWPLARGATVVVAGERMVERLTPADGGDCLVDLTRRHGVTLMQATPSFMAAVAAQPEALESLRPLRALLVGGETFPSGLARRLLNGLPEVRVLNMYGPTETTIWSTVHELDREVDLQATTLPIGCPIANTSIHVMTAGGREAPVGVAGELWIGGDGVAEGYLGRPELTAERFVEGPGGRAYRTGDRVRYRSDGALEFLGRIDRQVKILGHRIEPDEVESVLSRHPEVASVAVVAAERAGGGAELVSYIAPVSADGHGTRESSHVDHWRDVWEETYAPAAADGAGDFTGWLSSYGNRPIPEPEMREWLGCTIDRIRGVGARRIVDVGVGLGLYLRELAPDAESYTGIDLSPAALSKAAAAVKVEGRLPEHITLRTGDASTLAEIPDGDADLVLFNSVVQYFPSADYLRRVLREALRVAGPRGAVFIGDVRDLSLLPAHYADTRLRRTPSLVPARTVAAAAARALEEERELCLSAAFFTEFAAASGVQPLIELKQGRSDNELTRFRWDATLFGPDHPRRPGRSSNGTELPWIDVGDTAALDERLALLGPDRTLTVTGLPDRRLQRPLAALAALAGELEGDQTVWDVERLIWEAETDAAVHPEDLAELASGHGRLVRLRPAAADRPGEFDATFEPARTSTDPHHRERSL